MSPQIRFVASSRQYEKPGSSSLAIVASSLNGGRNVHKENICMYSKYIILVFFIICQRKYYLFCFSIQPVTFKLLSYVLTPTWAFLNFK